MTQIGEAIAPPVVHKDENEDCPFCPKEETNFKSHTDDKKDSFISYGGEKNDSKELSAIMLDPKKLVERQPNARPKDGVFPNQRSEKRPKDKAIYDDSEMGACSCEAHHLISGKQALEGETFERWIIASRGTIARDTGYSVNNAENGLWAPSIPVKYQSGGWAALKPSEKYRLARSSMKHTKIQFHKGHHAIPPKDPEQENYTKYNDYIKLKLKDMDERMQGWADVCSCTEKAPGKYQPSVRANESLDRLSEHLLRKLTGTPEKWEIFISAHARDYTAELLGDVES
ncbi:MAG: AHH domain-containing protein [Nibricoccus sp.]